MRSGRVFEADALAYLAQKWGDAGQARKAYLEAAREGRLDVYGRRGLLSPNRELIPREDWFQCDWYELPDPLSTGFHFAGRLGWHDREVRRDQLEMLVPRSRLQQNIADRHAAICAAIDQGARPETTDGGWVGIAKSIRAACNVTATTRGFGDKHIEREFRAELKRRGQWSPRIKRTSQVS
jgi:hypothetical protein